MVLPHLNHSKHFPDSRSFCLLLPVILDLRAKLGYLKLLGDLLPVMIDLRAKHGYLKLLGHLLPVMIVRSKVVQTVLSPHARDFSTYSATSKHASCVMQPPQMMHASATSNMHHASCVMHPCIMHNNHCASRWEKATSHPS